MHEHLVLHAKLPGLSVSTLTETRRTNSESETLTNPKIKKSQKDSMRLFASMTRIFITMLSTFFIGIQCSGQTVKTMDSLEESYQICLDKGANMLACSQVYYQQMDTMLNLVNKRLYKNLSASQRSALKSQQLKWLSRRDQYFKNIPLEPEEKILEKEDREMVVTDRRAGFVKERVIELLKML
jgi:uncharacterized protein YecT (DUF1311 family)